MNDSYHIEELEIRISNYLSGNCTCLLYTSDAADEL